MLSNGFFRVGAITGNTVIANPAANAVTIIQAAKEAAAQGVRLAVFSELTITSYTCADLFDSKALLEASQRAIGQVVALSNDIACCMVIGAPVIFSGRLYNCAVIICRGKVLGVVPKTYLPNYNEFYEKRWFAPAPESPLQTVSIAGFEAPFGVCQIIDVDGVKVGVEICEDLWSPVPPSSFASLAGAEVICNLSASDRLVGKAEYVRALVCQQSARLMCAYVYSSGAKGESTTDLVFTPLSFVAENGRMLASQNAKKHLYCDVDVEALRYDRMHNSTFGDCAAKFDDDDYVTCHCTTGQVNLSELLRKIDPTPFVPGDKTKLNERCREIIDIQSRGLQQRLSAAHCKHAVVGISGGLDSTLALLVTVNAFDALGLDRSRITGVTMPGFGTTGRTHDNALQLMDRMGVTVREINISAAVSQHFIDIGHDPLIHDVTYENAQARQRTYLLMDIANQCNGLVIGTGDMSELALGWATYNGDHMSMYGVNASVPKTLVRHLVQWFAETDKNVGEILADIIDTPISPELLPSQTDGTISQVTEDLVGPYVLHDFFMYYFLRYGFTADKIAFLARNAFEGEFDGATIDKWLTVFFKRFFSQQFKRSCMPDGPKVGSVCLSPRGDWRMPSDASSQIFLPTV